MKHKNIFRMLAVTLTLALLLVAIPAAPASAASIDVDPEEGEIGDEIEVSGAGFADSTEINIFFARQQADINDNINTDVAVYEHIIQKLTGIGGQLAHSFNIPEELTDGPDPNEDVYGGMYYIYVTYEYSPTIIKAVASVRVIGHAEVTDFDPDEGTVGTEVEIAGEGFSPEEAITVEYDGDEIDIESGDEETDDDGEFELTVIIPESTYGEHTITVLGEESLAELELEFFVIPEITIDPEEGEAGTLVTIVGTGFDRYGDVVITLDGDEVKEKRAGSDGSFDTYFTVPEVDAGPYTVIAEDEDDDDIWAEAEFTVIVFIPPLNPDIIVSPTSGNVGDEVTVSGTEFSPDDTVTIYLDGVSVGTAPTNEDGNFTFAFDIPASPGGSHTIKAEDTEDLSDTATLTVQASIIVNPTSGIIGSGVGVGGYGFGANKAITILFNNFPVTLIAPVITDANGICSNAQFYVPAGTVGTATITITDGTNSINTSFTVLAATASITPTTGIIGTKVTVSGTDFAAGGTVTIKYYMAAGSTTGDFEEFTATAGGDGVLSTTLDVPASEGGNHNIIITDGTNSINTSFTVLAATASISPTKGSTDTTVTVSGTNFAAGGTVTIKYYLAAGSTTGDFEEFTATAGGDGVLSTTFDVPASEGGNHNIIISDGTNSIDTSFTVESSDISISPKTSTASPGYIGIELTISGDGYAADAPVEVTYDGATLAIDPDKTDDNGSFTADFTIPESPKGEHTITLSIDDVEVEQFTFIMESTPPSAPIVISIYRGIRAKQPISLDWSDVTDPSLPVTYNLEIYTVEGTTEITVLEKTELTETEYTLTEAEKLEPVSKKAPYYWRVNAVDGADNISAWSDADSFYIGGGWPSWLTYLLIGLGALVVFVVALWLGRRTAFSSY